MVYFDKILHTFCQHCLTTGMIQTVWHFDGIQERIKKQQLNFENTNDN